MIDCLNNYIGVRNLAGYSNPDSGYFINDLQGITTNQLNEIADDDSEYDDIARGWQDIYARSTRLIESDLRSEMKKNFKKFSYFQTNITGQIDSNKDIDPSNNYNGWRFNFGFLQKNLSITLSKFDIFLREDADFDLYIFDLNTGKQLFTMSFSGSEGYNTFNLDKVYATHRYTDLYVAYDASQVSTKRMLEYYPGPYTTSGQISKSASLLTGNFDGENTGMSLTYSLQCSVNNFFCQRVEWFKDAFLYKLGVEFCNERIYSDRINRYTLMNRDDATQLRTELEARYQQLITNSLNDIQVTDNDYCFECTREFNRKTQLP